MTASLLVEGNSGVAIAAPVIGVQAGRIAGRDRTRRQMRRIDQLGARGKVSAVEHAPSTGAATKSGSPT